MILFVLRQQIFNPAKLFTMLYRLQIQFISKYRVYRRGIGFSSGFMIIILFLDRFNSFNKFNSPIALGSVYRLFLSRQRAQSVFHFEIYSKFEMLLLPTQIKIKHTQIGQLAARKNCWQHSKLIKIITVKIDALY